MESSFTLLQNLRNWHSLTKPSVSLDRVSFCQCQFLCVVPWFRCVCVFFLGYRRAWLNLISKSDNWNNSVACIGETTASAAKKQGLKSIYYPTTPGLEGYAHVTTQL
jgi:hypothetical protein